MASCRTSKAPNFGSHHRVALLMSSEVHDGENPSKSAWKWKDLSWKSHHFKVDFAKHGKVGSETPKDLFVNEDLERCFFL